MQHWICRAGRIAVLALLAGLAEAQDVTEVTSQTSARHLKAEVTNGLVTLKAHDVTIRQLVEEIAYQAGIQLILYKSLDERVSLDFYRLSLQQAVGRILRGRNFAFQCVQPLYTAVGPGEGIRGTLWVFPDSEDPETESVQPGPVRIFPLHDNAGSNDSLHRALTDDDPDVRLAAVSTLADSDGGESAAILVSALGDRSALVREEAVDVLAEVSDQTAIPFLEQALNDPDREVREAAIAALAHIGGDDAALALTIALSDTDVSLREEVVDALGDIGGKTATGLLRQALLDHVNLVREAAAENLAELSVKSQRGR